MFRSEPDWKLLRRPLITAGLVLMGSLVLIAVTTIYQQNTADTKRQGVAALAALQNSVYTALESERTVLEKYKDYQALEKSGFTGNDARLNWLETLREIADQLQIPSMQYQLRPEQPVSVPDNIDQGQYQLHASSMRLSLELLHEAELLRFLNHLEKRLPGLFETRSCRTKHVPEEQRVRAECELAWFTANRRGDDEGQDEVIDEQ